MLTRLHKFLFGPMPFPQPPHMTDVSFDSVEIEPDALRQLQAQLEAPGLLRSGLIVGRVADGTLTITHAIPAGYRSWRIAPLLGDPRYVLGYLDGLNAALAEPVDWYGHWVIPADNAVPDLQEVDGWLRHGRERLLFSPDHLLLGVGEQDGRLVVEGYRPVDRAIQAMSVDRPGRGK